MIQNIMKVENHCCKSCVRLDPESIGPQSSETTKLIITNLGE